METHTSTIDAVRDCLDQHHRHLAALIAEPDVVGGQGWARVRAFIAVHEEAAHRLLGIDPVAEPAAPEGTHSILDQVGERWKHGGPAIEDALRRHSRYETDGLQAAAGALSATQLGEVHRILDLILELDVSPVTFPAEDSLADVRTAARREVDGMLAQVR